MQQSQVDSLLTRLQQQVRPADKQNNTKGKAVFSWTLQQLSDATDGDLIGPVSDEEITFDSVSTDTRTLKPGALYIAIKGEHFDGHQFIDDAVRQGAVAVLVSSETETKVPGVVVEDTRLALGLFAKWHRQNMPLKKLVAITGSNGKTSVKTLLNDMFSQAGMTLATEGNLNNDFGVPRTLLNIRPEHEYAIIEMGANHPKEISYLTNLALPDIAILNNASGAHLEGFGSLQGVIDTKGEIFEGLNQITSDHSGVAVINTDSTGYEDWLRILDRLNVNRRIRFGTATEADIRMRDFAVNVSKEGIEFTLSVDGHDHSMSMPILGRHNALNAAACSAVAVAAGLPWAYIERAISGFSGVAGRLQKNKISSGWLIDDSYNANPESVKAGIDALTSLNGDAILCLGAMAEIGETSIQAHKDIADYAKQKGVKHLFVYGSDTEQMPTVFGGNSSFFDDHQQMVETVSALLQRAKQENTQLNILVKGSRSAQMEKVAQPLVEMAKPSDSRN